MTLVRDARSVRRWPSPPGDTAGVRPLYSNPAATLQVARNFVLGVAELRQRAAVRIVCALLPSPDPARRGICTQFRGG
jgi:hypothetical protein